MKFRKLWSFALIGTCVFTQKTNIGLTQQKVKEATAIGDSITYGSYLRYPQNENYFTLATQKSKIENIRNLSIPGATSQTMIDKELPKLDKNTDIIVINAGTNDTSRIIDRNENLDNDLENFKTLVKVTREKAPNAKIIIISLRHYDLSSEHYGLQATSGTIINIWNRNIKKLARDQGLSYIDISGDDYLTNTFDGLHPDEVGQAKIATALEATLAEKPKKHGILGTLFGITTK